MGKLDLDFCFIFTAFCLLSLRYKTTLILRDAAKFHPCNPQEFVFDNIRQGWSNVVNKLKNYTDIYKEQNLIFGSLK